MQSHRLVRTSRGLSGGGVHQPTGTRHVVLVVLGTNLSHQLTTNASCMLDSWNG